ncbi:VanZ family protein [Agromyces sp. NPDC060279]|uniref:VanZ family protein n=1 Tax=Agromyces sp. NPDC060279 TaxID=3347092 RepID=UPI0036493AF5
MTTVTERPGGRGAAAAAAALFAAYLVLLVWLVLWKLQLPWEAVPVQRSLKLVPFVAAEGYGASAVREVAGNVAVFVPFGLGLARLRPRLGWRRITAAAAGLSAGLELAQFALAVGHTDLTDVLTNTAGALLGTLLAGRRRRNPLVESARST